jgi:peptide/nickel transport system substrate-binding protein
VALLLAPALAVAGVRPAYGGTIRVGVPALPGSPGGAAADALVERATAAPLLELDAAGALVPGALAEVPSPEAGGRAWRLRVRPGLTDAAGRALGAADVAARLAALLSQPASPDAWAALSVLGADALLEGRAPILAGAQVLSQAELLVTLAFPLPEFPWLLATPALALPGAGPFAGPPRRGSGELVLPANERHHRGRPFASALRLQPVDARSAPRLLEQGAVDLVVRPEPAGGRQGPTAPLGVTVAALQPGRLGAGAPAVRAALAAVDRGELSRRFVRGPAEPLTTIVPPAILPGAAPGPAQDGGGPAPGRVVLLADASEPDQRALVERLQVKLFDRGIRASLDLAEPARFRARVAAGDYDVALVTVHVQGLRPALAAGQVAYAVRGAPAARRTLAALAGLEGDAAVAAVAREARELDVVPLVATGLRLSAAPALQGLAGRADGAFDPGALWILGAGGLP